MKNSEIVLKVYNEIKIKGICYKLGIYRDQNDIEQIVYDILLHYDNTKLNNIVDNGALLSFVYIVIRNQISNNPKSEWAILNHNETSQPDIPNEEIDEEYDRKMTFIEEQFNVCDDSDIESMSDEQQLKFVKKLLLKNKIIRGWSYTEMHKRLNMSRNSINDICQSVKKELKNEYKNQKNI